MDIRIKLYLERSENEIRLATVLRNLSNSDDKAKFGAEKNDTFYSSAITHAYYAIFYAAKALLLTRNINTEAPEIHKKTFESFKTEFVDSGILDVQLFKIYKEMLIRADVLLGIFELEKRKRGTFTYKTLPQANLEPAIESIENGKTFIKHIKVVLEKLSK